MQMSKYCTEDPFIRFFLVTLLFSYDVILSQKHRICYYNILRRISVLFKLLYLKIKLLIKTSLIFEML